MFFAPKDGEFFDLFERAADNMVRTAELFRELVSDYDRRMEVLGAIREAEHRGDSVTHDTITKLDKTFITPLDREDIHALITETDDVVDMLDAAAQRMILYKIEKPTEDMIRQAENVVRITEKLAEAIRLIRHIKKTDRLSRLLIEIHDWENKGDELNHTALARLFEQSDPITVIKWKELYDLVEASIDACETVAHTIRSIMVKNA